MRSPSGTRYEQVLLPSALLLMRISRMVSALRFKWTLRRFLRLKRTSGVRFIVRFPLWRARPPPAYLSEKDHERNRTETPTRNFDIVVRFRFGSFD